MEVRRNGWRGGFADPNDRNFRRADNGDFPVGDNLLESESSQKTGRPRPDHDDVLIPLHCTCPFDFPN